MVVYCSICQRLSIHPHVFLLSGTEKRCQWVQRRSWVSGCPGLQSRPMQTDEHTQHRFPPPSQSFMASQQFPLARSLYSHWARNHTCTVFVSPHFDCTFLCKHKVETKTPGMSWIPWSSLVSYINNQLTVSSESVLDRDKPKACSEACSRMVYLS